MSLLPPDVVRHTSPWEEEEETVLLTTKENPFEPSPLLLDFIKEKRELLDKALEHIIGATVIEFGHPQYDEDDHESGYLVVRTAQGMEIIITSTHSVWDYGDSSNDNLWLSIRESSS